MRKAIDLSHIYRKKYENKWVAVTRDYKKIVGSSTNFQTLHKRIGDDDITYLRVPTLDRLYAF